ncbi:MAG: hypothetical protein ACRC3B_17695, partial [Bacteroidia bacterium]
YLLFVCKTERLKGLEQIVVHLISNASVAEKLQFAYGGYEFMVPLSAEEMEQGGNLFYRKLSFPVEIWQYRQLLTGNSASGEPMYRKIFVKTRKLLTYYQCEHRTPEYAAVS